MSEYGESWARHRPQPVQNTDRELYREPPADVLPDGCENRVFVTKGGGIGMNVGGTVIVQPIAEWHRQALAAHQQDLGIDLAAGDYEVIPSIELCSECRSPKYVDAPCPQTHTVPEWKPTCNCGKSPHDIDCPADGVWPEWTEETT